MKKTHVGICLVNFRQPKLTRQCLISIQKQTFSDYHVYLLDNGVRDSKDKTEIREFKQITYTALKENTGFAKGTNRLLKQALNDNCEILICLNNDTTVRRDWLQEIVKASELLKDSDLLGCVILKGNDVNNVWFSGGTLHTPWLIPQHPGMNRPLKPFETLLSPTEWVTGCCMLMKREFLIMVGFFDEHFFMYGEDIDLCLRAQKQRGRCYVLNKPLVTHYASAASGGSNRLTETQLKWKAASYGMLMKKHAFLSNRWLNSIGALVESIILWGLARMTLLQIAMYVKNVFTFSR